MKFDLHVHSEHSKDSNSSHDDILEAARKKGLDGFAICDHDTIEGGLACEKRALELGFELTIIPGVEVTCSKGHILVLGVRQNIEPLLSPEETIKRARKLGGTVIIPHPFKRSSHGIGSFEGLDIDAVEVFNSRCLFNSANRKAATEAERLGIPGVSGSDSHIPEMVGQAYTEIDALENTVDAVLEAIREGKVSPAGKNTPTPIILKQMSGSVRRRIKKKLFRKA
ncbi:MAG: PHP domain-containing protein [Methanosarcina sp.]|jgi:predicted metal-dependent phosphoesterase TrpH|nr:PHP domain-containing protein [Methanosarcina sp.]MDD3317033.1 PHP domain-containing protein [Methanosarcina sp.]MDD4304977.1 PHP domain-containing protein [Methanosarcina sp.]MDD4619547.1 PHP domain-containing protein [Methanosarcina sp.]